MKQFFYKIFHANLAFSSIPDEQIDEVILKTYFPLLNVIESTKIKVALEISAYSLELIKRLQPKWIDFFKKLYKANLIELIGSGYMQIIGPLVPYEVNLKNQKIGLSIYQEILGIKPVLVFVNEQTFSQSLVDLYSEVGYQGIIMEWNNAYTVNSHWDKSLSYQPILLEGNNSILPLIWADSILFQQFQRYIHGEKSKNTYFNFLNHYTKDHQFIPIYSSDLEVFNFRPGRFETEAIIDNDEWKKIECLANELKEQAEFIFPSEILNKNTKINKINTIVGKEYPIIVKKQDKYSLSRWAACGRGAAFINTLCYRYFIDFNKSTKNWKLLLKYWGSDYRTHITESKWDKAIDFLSESTEKIRFDNKSRQIAEKSILREEDEYVIFEKGFFKIIFNKNKGFMLDSVFFKDIKQLFGTIKHGTLDYIYHGADYYTGTATIESSDIKKIANLNMVDNYSFEKLNNNKYVFTLKLVLKNEIIETRKWIIDLNENSITFNTKIKLKEFIRGSIRLGTFTLLQDFVNESSYIKFKNGGENYEKIYLYKNEINHHKTKSLFQSSSSGIGVTDGCIKFYSEDKEKFEIQLNRKVSYPFILLHNNEDKKGYLTRIYFSLQEIDDTLKYNTLRELDLEYKILIKG